jgi:hypothetical protein
LSRSSEAGAILTGVVLCLMGSLVLGGCSAVDPSATPTPTANAGSPSSSVEAASAAALTPCVDPQVLLTPGATGAAAGTNYLRVFAELAQGPPCTLPRSPMISVTTDGGTEVARSTETDATAVVLDYITGYNIGWNAPCGPTPSGELVASITFTPALVVRMPLGSFRPSCVDGTAGWSISMTADDGS